MPGCTSTNAVIFPSLPTEGGPGGEYEARMTVYALCPNTMCCKVGEVNFVCRFTVESVMVPLKTPENWRLPDALETTSVSFTAS